MSGKAILRNAFSLFISNVVVRIGNAVAIFLVARYLGAHNYGILSVAMAFASIAGYFTDAGLGNTLMREGTKPNANLDELISSFIRTRLVLAAGTALVSAVLIPMLYSDPQLHTIIYWVVLPMIFGAALQGVGTIYFQVIQKMQYTAMINGIVGLITTGTLVVSVIMKFPLAVLAAAYGFSSLGGGLFSVWMASRQVSLTSRWNPALLKGLLSFTAAGLAVMTLPQLGPIVLPKFTSLQQVGYFSAAYRIPAMLYQVPGILAAAFYPLLFQYGNEKKLDTHLNLSISELKLMSVLGILMALPFLFYSHWWMTLLLGSQWLPAGSVLKVVSWMVIIQSINYPLADALTTKGMQNRRSFVLGIAVLVGITAYTVLGREWGGLGGAMAAVLIECTLTLGFTLINPSGWTLLYKGFRFNLAALIVVLLIGLALSRYVYPLAGVALLEIIFILVAITIDRELKDQSFAFVRDLLRKQ